MLYKIKNEEEGAVSKRSADLKLEVTHLSLEEKLDEQHFHYHAPDLIESLTKTVKDTCQILHKKSSATTKAFHDIFEFFPLNTLLIEKETKDETYSDSNSSTTITRSQKVKDILQNKEKRNPIPFDTIKDKLSYR